MCSSDLFPSHDTVTRIRENIQYYFVPFQSLWKYFEQQVNNMTRGDAGQNISKFAMSSTEASQISTSMPYISYVDLASWLDSLYSHAVSAFSDYVKAVPNSAARSAVDFKNWCDASTKYNDVFVCDGYRPYRDWETDRKSTRLNSSHITRSRMPSSA